MINISALRRAIFILIPLSLIGMLVIDYLTNKSPEAVISQKIFQMASAVEKSNDQDSGKLDEQIALVSNAKAGLSLAEHTAEQSEISLAPQLSFTHSRKNLAGLIGRIRMSTSFIAIELGLITVTPLPDEEGYQASFEARVELVAQGTKKVFNFHYETRWELIEGEWLLVKSIPTTIPVSTEN